MTGHIDNYDDLNVDEVIDALDSLEQDQLVDVLEYEKDNDERVTVTREINDRIGGDSNDGTNSETTAEDETTESDDGGQSEEVQDTPSEVRLRCEEDGYHGGEWWDEPGERTVTYNERVRQAVENDRALEVVDDV